MADKIWYYVGSDGSTNGPVTLDTMKPLFGNEIKNETFIWNGTTVPQWTALEKLPDIHSKLRPQKLEPKDSADSTASILLPQNILDSPPKSAPPKTVQIPNSTATRRRSALGAGGRVGLLAALRKGATLKKAPKPKEKSSDPSSAAKTPMSLAEQLQMGRKRMKKAPKPNTVKPAPKGPLSMMDQMKLAMEKRKKKSGLKVEPKKNWSANSSQKSLSSSPIGSGEIKKNPWKSKQKTKSPSSPGGGEALGYRKDKMVTKLKTAEEWQLKAIEAILK